MKPVPPSRTRAVSAASLFAVAFAVYAATYLVWVLGDQEAYLALVRFWGIDAWHRPFLDLTTMIGWSECRRLGYDVYVQNSCTPLGLYANYGPLLTLLPLTRSADQPLGILISIAFLAAAAAVIRPRTGREWIAAALAVLSTSTLLALERDNLDLVLFVAVAAGVALSGSGSGRLAAYGLYYFAGILKFYPFALFAVVVREKPKRALAVGFAAAAAIIAFGFVLAPRLAAIAAHLPVFYYNSDSFGAAILPYGLAAEFDLPTTYAAFGSAGLILVAAGLAIWLARAILRDRPKFDWSVPDGRFLAAGAILMSACFFGQFNIAYRAIFYVMLLPGLFELIRRLHSEGLKRIVRFALWSIPLLLWSEFVHRLLSRAWNNAEWPERVFFVTRECVWWGLATVTAAIVLVFVTGAPAFKPMRRRLTR